MIGKILVKLQVGGHQTNLGKLDIWFIKGKGLLHKWSDMSRQAAVMIKNRIFGGQPTWMCTNPVKQISHADCQLLFIGFEVRHIFRVQLLLLIDVELDRERCGLRLLYVSRVSVYQRIKQKIKRGEQRQSRTNCDSVPMCLSVLRFPSVWETFLTQPDP